jgi:hypothetical protein
VSIAHTAAVYNGRPTPAAAAIECTACPVDRVALSTSVNPAIAVADPRAVSAEALSPVAHTTDTSVCGCPAPHGKAVNHAVVVQVIIANATLIYITCTARDSSTVDAGGVVSGADPTKVDSSHTTPDSETIFFAVVPIQCVTRPTLIFFSDAEQFAGTISAADVATIAFAAGVKFLVSAPNKHAVLVTVIQLILVAHIALIQSAIAEWHASTVQTRRSITGTHVAYVHLRGTSPNGSAIFHAIISSV